MGDVLVRSIVVQLAATTGPADGRSWCRSGPNAGRGSTGCRTCASPDAGVRTTTRRCPVPLAEHGAPDTSSWHLLLVDPRRRPARVRTSGLRRLLHVRPDVALLVSLGADPHAAPALCERVWAVLADGRLRASHTGLAAGLADGRPGRAPCVWTTWARAPPGVPCGLVGRRDPEAPD